MSWTCGIIPIVLEITTNILLQLQFSLSSPLHQAQHVKQAVSIQHTFTVVVPYRLQARGVSASYHVDNIRIIVNVRLLWLLK